MTRGTVEMFRYMNYLLAIYEKQSFSRAAESLFISQPALSHIVKKVETELGAPIFDRSSSPIRVTEAGKYYIQAAKQIQSIEQDLRSHFAQYSKQNMHPLVVGASSYFCTYILPDCAAAFEVVYPDRKVSVLEANTDDLRCCMENGAIDICINVDKIHLPGVVSKPWMKEHIILAVPARFQINEAFKAFQLGWDEIVSQSYQDAPAVSLRAFADQPFLFLKERSDLYERGMKMCLEAGFQPKVAMCLDQMLTAYHIVQQGHGVSMIRAEMVAHMKQSNDIVFYRIDSPLTVRDVCFYFRAGSSAQEAIQAFIDFLANTAG